jgi:hypothetical protein
LKTKEEGERNDAPQRVKKDQKSKKNEKIPSKKALDGYSEDHYQ